MTIIFDQNQPAQGGNITSQPIRDNFNALSSANSLRATSTNPTSLSLSVEPGAFYVDNSIYKIYSGGVSPAVPQVTGIGMTKICVLAIEVNTTTLGWISGNETGGTPAVPVIPEGFVALCHVVRTQSGNTSPILDADIVNLRSFGRTELAMTVANKQTLTAGAFSDASSLHSHDGRYYTEAEVDARLASYQSLLPHWKLRVYAPSTFPQIIGNDPNPSQTASFSELVLTQNTPILIPTIDGSISGYHDSVLRMLSSSKLILKFSMKVNVVAPAVIPFSFYNFACRSNIYVSNAGGGSGLTLLDRTGYFPENAITTGNPSNAFSVEKDYNLALPIQGTGVYDIEIMVVTLQNAITTTPGAATFICLNKMLNNPNIVWLSA